MPRKVFVGSLPNGIGETTLRATFQQYGQVEDVFVKQGCEAGRQWAFITFSNEEQAQLAKESCDRILTFPGADRPCDVMVAKNQGMFGQQVGEGIAVQQAAAVVTPGYVDGPKKIFVGSLPDGVTDAQLRTEFSRYGAVIDTFVKQGCESGRQWAFVSFNSHQEAQLAKVSTDRLLVMPGASRACEVTLARNQGQFGQDPIAAGSPAAAVALPVSAGPKKIFVGSLPDNISEHVLRSEFERYGQVVDIFHKTSCEPGRQWAFITYASPEQANLAKESTDRILVLPGGDRACEVMLARNQGMNGAEPINRAQPVAAAPPATAALLSPWRCYQTESGLPYYHNHLTGVTQWERPAEFQAAAAAMMATAQVRYAPY
eukprot:CAMPEP_0197894780 /NCGR_PEP_ID=MMETSP1439-20131203/36012_1 /TAXON_ID=66791 /ORGANISM="Gonyaulax spinifera, Strain CCMP409" /LENGTH=372 /DNA_ID=CAMNT_0043515163 /DNA_START=32 /DNA_END=1150 /DNA_ORIENTATION=-